MTLNEGRPFLRSEARHLSDGQLRRGYRALFQGVYVRHRTPVGDLELAEAALLVAEPGSYVSHHTAARLLGAVAPGHPDVHVTSHRLRVKGAGLTGHRAKVLVIVSQDLYATPAKTLARITRAMRRAGMPSHRLRDEWRRHFPSRPGDLEIPA